MSAGKMIAVPPGHTVFSWASRNHDESIPCGHTWSSWYGTTMQGPNDESRARAFGKLAGVVRGRGQPKRALVGLKNALDLAPALPATHFNLGCVWDDLGAKPLSIAHFEAAAMLKPSFVEAWNCLAGALLKRGSLRDLNVALECCEQVLHLKKNDDVAQWNLGSALRRLNRSDEAIDRAWSSIRQRACLSESWKPSYVDVTKNNNQLESLELERSSPPQKISKPAPLAIVCVKWGTKYSAEYVNKLQASVRRHLQGIEHGFFCFTEDPQGVEGETRPLPENSWTGWWHKASALFSGHLEKHIPSRYERIVYLDLDTIIVGSLDEIVSYQGLFATLYTNEFSKTEDRTAGYNSSVMLFPRGQLLLQEAIFGQLSKIGIEFITSVVHRLDFWLEMTVKHADSLQILFPGQLLDYKTHVRDNKEPPDGSRVINFPLHPKPHDIVKTEVWAQENWQ